MSKSTNRRTVGVRRPSVGDNGVRWRSARERRLEVVHGPPDSMVCADSGPNPHSGPRPRQPLALTTGFCSAEGALHRLGERNSEPSAEIVALVSEMLAGPWIQVLR
jgi:hypothetical protein